MKACFKCGETKAKTEFYKHPGMADGRLGKCKPCARVDVKANRIKNADYYKEFDRVRGRLPHRLALRRAYSLTVAGKESSTRGRLKYRSKHPEKYKANSAVSNALRSGRLVKQPCQECGEEKVHGHHEDYSKPLDVIWLCSNHHTELHKQKKRAK